eukprot:g12456.t1
MVLQHAIMADFAEPLRRPNGSASSVFFAPPCVVGVGPKSVCTHNVPTSAHSLHGVAEAYDSWLAGTSRTSPDHYRNSSFLEYAPPLRATPGRSTASPTPSCFLDRANEPQLTEDEMQAAPPPNNWGGGDPPKPPACRDCSKPLRPSGMGHECKLQVHDRKKEQSLAQEREEQKRWDQQLSLFWSALGVGLSAGLIYRLRKFLTRPKLTNRYGEEVGSDEGGEIRV